MTSRVDQGQTDIDHFAKLAFLQDPANYPERPRRVIVVETHFAWVFLTEKLAYKMKKPVCIGPADLRGLAARRRACLGEVRLNRRLTSDVYRGVVPLAPGPSGALRLGGSGQPVEWLVEMRRLPAERMLDHALAAGSARPRELARVGKHLAHFYAAEPPLPLSASEYLEGLRVRLQREHTELASLDATHCLESMQALEARFEAFLAQAADLLAQRTAEHRIVEAHGDLRLEHVCLGPQPQIIDCLDFDRNLRVLDAAEDLAFLFLECERVGAAWAAEAILDGYREASGDRPHSALMSFYRATRALVRAKLASRRQLEDDPELASWQRKTREYLEIAARELQHALRSSRVRAAARQPD